MVKSFQAEGIPKSARIGIDGFEGVIPKAPHNHNYGWVSLKKRQIESLGYSDVTILDKTSSYNDYDVILIHFGINFAGSVNYFGGINDQVVNRYYRFQVSDKKFFALDHEMPLIGESIKGRMDNASSSKRINILSPTLLDEKFKKIKTFTQIVQTDSLCFGDSHSFSVARLDQMLSRNDGLTLYSTLENGLEKTINEKSGIKLKDLKKLTIYLGNIDIRHHILRQENPLSAMNALLEKYSIHLDAIRNKFPDLEVTLTELLPIECIGRSIPKTGWYKGTPYYGSWEERSYFVDYANNYFKVLAESGAVKKLIKWPEWYRTSTGELDMAVMERPRSVHLSPQFHLWNSESEAFRCNRCEQIFHSSESIASKLPSGNKICTLCIKPQNGGV